MRGVQAAATVGNEGKTRATGGPEKKKKLRGKTCSQGGSNQEEGIVGIQSSNIARSGLSRESIGLQTAEKKRRFIKIQGIALSSNFNRKGDWKKGEHTKKKMQSPRNVP